MENAANGGFQSGNLAKYNVIVSGTSLFSWRFLSRPLVIFQRQCQVNKLSTPSRSPFAPFFSIGVMVNVARTQGSPSIWGGIGGDLMVFVVQNIAGSLLNEFPSLPKNITDANSAKKVAGYLLNKSIGSLFASPFYASSVIHSIQSHVDGEGPPSVLECIQDGFGQLFGYTYHSPHHLPLYVTTPAFVLHSLLHDVIQSASTSLYRKFFPVPNHDDPDVNAVDFFHSQIMATFFASSLSSAIVYPIETVLHRLIVQGTQTIIDNTETGMDFVPVHTNYQGFIDCVYTIVNEEGWLGFYKGFSAVILQILLGVAIAQTSKIVLGYFDTSEKREQ